MSLLRKTEDIGFYFDILDSIGKGTTVTVDFPSDKGFKEDFTVKEIGVP